MSCLLLTKGLTTTNAMRLRLGSGLVMAQAAPALMSVVSYRHSSSDKPVMAIRRETINVWERRTPLSPQQVKQLIRKGVKVIVQPSDRRAYSTKTSLEPHPSLDPPDNKMSVQRLVKQVVMCLMSLYYGAIVTFRMAKLVVSLGPAAVFSAKTYPRPEVLDDPDLGEHGFLQLEEVRLHYVASGQQGKPLMLFLHGFPEFWYSWRHQIREFQKDYRVVALDQRGYSQSDKPRGWRNYAQPKLMNDVRQAIEALGYQSCVLVAHDWGGVVAWEFGRHFPDYVDKLVVMNSPPDPVFARAIKEVKEQVKMSWYMFLFQLPYLPELFCRHCDFALLDRILFGIDSPAATDMISIRIDASQADLDAYKYTFSQPGALSPPIDWYRAAFRSPRNVYDMGYTVPCLLVWGMKDVALHSKIPELTEQMKGDANITVTRIPEAGHFVQMDKPELVNAAVRDWLALQS